MNSLLSKITSLGKKGGEDSGFAQKAEEILSDGFDISRVDQIGDTELRQIFSYQFTTDSRKSFFIIFSDELKEKGKFDTTDIDICCQSQWFMLVVPSHISHIITPKRGWIKFNGSNIHVSAIDRDNPWTYNGGTFQLDKNIGLPILYSQVSLEKMLELGQQYISQSLEK